MGKGVVMLLKSRVFFIIAILITISLGLLSRASFVDNSGIIYLYVGDALWASLIFWLVCLIMPKVSISYQLVIALLFCFSIEFSQLYQAQWINTIRATTLGGLVLGFGFKFSDLVAYSIGVALSVNLKYLLIELPMVGKDCGAN